MQCKGTNNSSLSARIMYKSLLKVNSSEKIFENLINKPKRGNNELSVSKISKKLNCLERYIDGHKVLTVCKNTKATKHILLFHGGAYVAEATAGHRYILEHLALQYGYRVSFLDYPLAPENTAEKTIGFSMKAYQLIQSEYEMDTLFFFGDSAGGGLALALLQSIRNDSNLLMPSKTVLVSPLLDATISNPAIDTLIERDVILNVEGLRKCASLYAGGIDIEDPRISPINGRLDSLSDIMILVSNYEIFYPDCVSLKCQLDKAKASTGTLIVKEHLIHDWIVLPIKERDETIAEINEFFLN